MNLFSRINTKTFQFPGRGKVIKDRSALHIAVLEDDAEQVEFLLTHNASPNGRDANGHTPFHYAVASRNMAIAQRLLDAGAEVNIRDWKRRTILGILTSPTLDKLDIQPDGASFAERIQFLRDNSATT